jgi:hypothetical protein
MRRVAGGIRLCLLSSTLGVRGEQVLITQEEWQKFGTESYEMGTTLAKLRDQQHNLNPPKSS